MGTKPYILVTYDNDMPEDHAPLLQAYGTTLAIIDKTHYGKQDVLGLKQYWYEVIHRHAHRFVAQDPGTIYKYRSHDRRTKVTL